MARIQPIEPSRAEGKSRDLLEAVRKQMGTVSNIFKDFTHSPAAFDFYLSQSKALAGGALDSKLREQTVVSMAGTIQCDFCASAHTFLGRKKGVSASELAANLGGQSEDAQTEAALRFAKTIAEIRGRVDDADLQHIREGGFSETEIIEVIAHVGMNLFTNTFNNVADTEDDFPRVETTRRASATYLLFAKGNYEWKP